MVDSMNFGAGIPQNRHGFATGEYRICRICAITGERRATNLYAIGAAISDDRPILRFGDSFRLQVSYECLMSQLPDVSCGVAAAFTRQSDMQHAMYFNTNYPHSDEEMRTYYDYEFRKHIGRCGTVEAYFPKLQVQPGDYLLTVAILPNRPSLHEFYELHYLRYGLVVVWDGPKVPAAFHANVSFSYRPVSRPEGAEILDLPAEVPDAVTVRADRGSG
jgi:hypothetical protein